MAAVRRTSLARLAAALVCVLSGAVGLLVAAPMFAMATTYDTVAYSYDATTPLSTSHASDGPARASPAGPGVASLAGSVSVWGFGVAAETAGSIRAVNPLGGGMNCVNCTVATDATLAGSPASALLSGPKPISVLEQIYGGSFKPVSGQAEIAGILTEAGNGARGIVYGSRSGGVGHVFNAVNQGGTIRFLDGQTGGAASFSGFDSFMFLGTN